MKAVLSLLLALLCCAAYAGSQGIGIGPDGNGRFVYTDDFKTPRFLLDGFVSNLGAENWTPGALQNQGPNRSRTLTYRFYSDRAITGVTVSVTQSANARNLGGVNWLMLSKNGLDWATVAESSTQRGDTNGTQSEPLVVSGPACAKFTSGGEVWARLVMDNHSGLPTSVSNIISGIRVDIGVGKPLSAATDPQASARRQWGKMVAKAKWSAISLDVADPIGLRPPHYHEDSDGWLQPPGANPNLDTNELTAFRVRKVALGEGRSPLSFAVFLSTRKPGGALTARVDLLCTKDSSRRVRLTWDGRQVTEVDTGSYFDAEKSFYVPIPELMTPGTHEFRIAGLDGGAVAVKRISFCGSAQPAFARKPKLATGKLEVLSAYYMPDPEPPAASQAVEGRTEKQDVGLTFTGMQSLYARHDEFGAVRMLLRNPGKTPVRISDRLMLNGKPVETAYVDFVKSAWDARGVVWYRVRPKLVKPGECAEVYIRFRHRPEGAFALIAIPTENAGTIAAKVSYSAPGILVDYVVTDASRRTLLIYIRRSREANAGVLTGVMLDGTRLPNAEFHQTDFAGNVALAVAKLSKPLVLGSYHVVGAVTSRGKRVDTQFRVMKHWFPRSSIHVSPDMCKEMNMNLSMWHERPLAECDKYGVFTTTGNVFDLHRRVVSTLGPDEPDANDNVGGGYDRGLGSNARRLAHSGWQELVQRNTNPVATWIIMNGTVRPLNWSVYGQFADITCFDPYPVTYYGVDHQYVSESLNLARLCGAPKPMYACMEAFGWAGGQGVPEGARGPTPQEYPQNVVQAIGAGMKGLTSWVYVSGAGGWELNPPVRAEIAKLNKLIEHIEDYLIIGCPADLASCGAGMVPTGTVGNEKWPKPRVTVSALLCGPDALVVTAANHIPASRTPPSIEPARDVRVQVRLPKGMRAVEAFEVTEDGLRPARCSASEGKAIIEVDSLESGKVFLLKRKS